MPVRAGFALVAAPCVGVAGTLGGAAGFAGADAAADAGGALVVFEQPAAASAASTTIDVT
jgi:hypothetical protein